MAGESDKAGLAVRVAMGAIAGAAATAALVSTVRRLQPRGGPPVAPDLSTFLYGAIGGAALAAAEPRLGRLTGALAGGGLWLAGEVGALPKISIGPEASKLSGAASLAGHVAWGWSVAEAIRDADTLRGALIRSFDRA